MTRTTRHATERAVFTAYGINNETNNACRGRSNPGPLSNNQQMNTKTITVRYLDAADWRSKQQPVAIIIVDQRFNHDIIRLTVAEARQLVARLTAALPVE